MHAFRFKIIQKYTHIYITVYRIDTKTYPAYFLMDSINENATQTHLRAHDFMNEILKYLLVYCRRRCR